MIHTILETVEQLIIDAGLDLGAVALIVAEALDEDLGGRGVLPAGASAGVDVTSVATIPADATAAAVFVARAAGTLAGLPVAAYTMAKVCAAAGPYELELVRADGDRVVRDDVLASVIGNARAMLRAERIALNLLTSMSGVATATAAWVDALAGTRAAIRDSRKTIPGMRMLHKYAVRVGGGINHRMCLADAALIKDNHVLAAGGVVEAYEAVRAAFPDIGIQVEVTSAEQARAVVGAGATDILLDNMNPEQMRSIVDEFGDRATFEASGGLSLEDAAAVAATGVNYLAVGAITHSPKILDIALDFVPNPESSGNLPSVR